jgi:hypothetical protein
MSPFADLLLEEYPLSPQRLIGEWFLGATRRGAVRRTLRARTEPPGDVMARPRLAVAVLAVATAVALPLGPLNAAASAGGTPAHTRSVGVCTGACLTPPPTGPFAVGRTDVPVEAEGVSAVTAWYPASAGTGSEARLLPAAWADLLEDYFGHSSLDEVVTYAREDAEARPGPRRPVLVLSPGWGMVSALYGSTAEDLASHGYVVVGVDPVPETEPVPTDNDLRRRVAGATRVLHRLRTEPGPLAGTLDLTRVGGLGHSYGGAALIAMLADGKDLRTAVNLDGSVFGPVLTSGVGRAALIVSGDQCRDVTHDALKQSSGDLLQVRRVIGAAHLSFSDVVHLGDVGGTTPAREVAAVQRELLVRWFDDTVAHPRRTAPRVPSSPLLSSTPPGDCAPPPGD